MMGYEKRARAASSGSDKALDEVRQNWKALLAPNADITLSTESVRKSKAEWQQALTKEQFAVLREEATEPPGSSPLNGEKRPGVFVCAGCSLPLFTSLMKFESGTGWPSFFTSIPNQLKTKADFQLGQMRKEYHCARCSGHQGHVFDDGPRPTGERWCNNGLALRFIPL